LGSVLIPELGPISFLSLPAYLAHYSAATNSATFGWFGRPVSALEHKKAKVERLSRSEKRL
jgi:hypothetical protein